MRSLVTDGAGYLDATLCARLLDRGDRVVWVDNLIAGSAKSLNGLVEPDGFSFVEADVGAEVHVDGSPGARFALACPASPAKFGLLALEITGVRSRGVARLLDVAAAGAARLARQELRWGPTTCLRDGLARTVGWFSGRPGR